MPSTPTRARRRAGGAIGGVSSINCCSRPTALIFDKPGYVGDTWAYSVSMMRILIYYRPRRGFVVHASVLHAASSQQQQRGRTPKSELGFSMTLARATPGIRPEGRRLGTLRLGRRLETQKIGLNPRARASSRSSFSPLAGRAAPAGLQNRAGRGPRGPGELSFTSWRA